MRTVHGLNFDNLRGDIYGGLSAAVVALPLALAFGVASGAGPVAGLYGAIFVGFFAGAFGAISGAGATMRTVVKECPGSGSGELYQSDRIEELVRGVGETTEGNTP